MKDPAQSYIEAYNRFQSLKGRISRKDPSKITHEQQRKIDEAQHQMDEAFHQMSLEDRRSIIKLLSQ